MAGIIAAIIFSFLTWLVLIPIMLALITVWLSEYQRNPRVPREATKPPAIEYSPEVEARRRREGLRGTQAEADSHVAQMAREFSELTSK